MSVVLVILGVLGAAAGAAMVGFGIPVKEFSLGNTLIMAGTTAVAGGLIVIGLGIVVRRLQVIADLLAMRAPTLQPARPGDLSLPSVPPRPPAAGRVPFPPRRDGKAKPDLKPETGPETKFETKPETKPEIAPDLRPEPPLATTAAPPPPVEPLPEPIERNVFRPMLRDVFEPVPPAPPELEGAAPPVGIEPAHQDFPPQSAPSVDLPPPEPPRRESVTPSVVFAGSSFEAIWRDEPAPPPAAPVEPPRAAETVRRVVAPAAPPVTPVHPSTEPRALAILKSGVVDGMGYTLYTDGSIEAELPQGTARFASIAELREHLEKNTAKVPDAD